MSRPQIQFRTCSVENYNLFCKEHPDIVISFEKYKEVLYLYNKLIADHILDTGDKIKLPFGLGVLSINKYKPKKFKKTKDGRTIIGLPIDWVESNKQGKRVYHLNFHTDGYKFNWIWMSEESRIKFYEIWKLEMARIPRRKLPQLLKGDPKYKNLYREYTVRNH